MKIFDSCFNDPHISKIKSNKEKLIIKVKQNPKQWTNKSIDMMVTSSESALIAPELYLNCRSPLIAAENYLD